jgi:hypothetical protein
MSLLDRCITRTFYISTESRDKSKFPHPAQFTYELPIPLKNVIGVHVRHYKYPKEPLVNGNNFRIQVVTPSINGELILNKGDYSLIALLTEINSKLSLYGVEFTVDDAVGRVVLTFVDSFADDYVILQGSTLLKALGFDNSICLCREGILAPASYRGNTYEISAVAEYAHDVNTISDMVLRITDLEAVMSNDSITNRATAILYSNLDVNYAMLPITSPRPWILLQKQHRLQSFRFNLLNTQGQLYDIVGSEATFLLDVYCMMDDDTTRDITVAS